MNTYIYLAGAIVSEVVATTALRSVEGFTRISPTVLCVGGYLLSFFLLSKTLTTIPAGIAYAIWAGVGIVLVSLAAWLLYGQRLDLPAVVGMFLIICGVLVIHLFSTAVTH